jgi:hypothetical protein
MLAPELQDVLAMLILQPPDERVVDEVAFSVANVTEHDLALPDFDPAVITDNALGIYEFDEAIDYAEVVDTGAPGDDDYSSTVSYQYLGGNGKPATTTLAPDDYYWWVVHPKLDFEDLVPVDPTTGKPAATPTGVHWRRYLMQSSTETFDYRDHYLLRKPVDLRGKELALSGSAHLTDPVIYPLRPFVDEAGNGLLVEVDLGDGTLLASTLDVAEAYADEGAALLVNLASYGNTNLTLKPSADVALVMDAVPWGKDAYTLALGEQKIVPTIVGATAFGTLALAEYDKIIVASDQDAAFYQAVAARTADLEAYVQAGGVLELDLYTDADLSALTFPNGIQVAGGAPASVLAEGQPRLGDYLTETPLLWDGIAPSPGLSGDRPPKADGQALDIIGWFVSQNMFDNVAEYGKAQKVVSPERSWYPQRIIHNHYGNCGELGDLLAASGRAALLPVRVLGSVEDHCWNDVRVGERWVPWQVSWSDGPTDIDNPGVGADEEHGGGKKLSGIYTVRGDGFPDDTAVSQYSDTVSIVISVRDRAGRPIDGALVLIVTEAFYDPNKRSLAAVGYTHADGEVTLTLGNDRNYWLYVSSAAGGWVEYPVDDLDPETYKTEVLSEAAEATPGAVISREVVLEVDLPVPTAESVAPEPNAAAAIADIEARVLASWIVTEGFFTEGRFIAPDNGATARYYLLDQAGYEALINGQAFTALAAAEDAADLVQADVAVPAAGPVWLVALNPSVTETLEVSLSLHVAAP